MPETPPPQQHRHQHHHQPSTLGWNGGTGQQQIQRCHPHHAQHGKTGAHHARPQKWQPAPHPVEKPIPQCRHQPHVQAGNGHEMTGARLTQQAPLLGRDSCAVPEGERVIETCMGTVAPEGGHMLAEGFTQLIRMPLLSKRLRTVIQPPGQCLYSVRPGPALVVESRLIDPAMHRREPHAHLPATAGLQRHTTRHLTIQPQAHPPIHALPGGVTHTPNLLDTGAHLLAGIGLQTVLRQPGHHQPDFQRVIHPCR